MPVVSTENVSVFIPLILRGKVSGSGAYQLPSTTCCQVVMSGGSFVCRNKVRG